MKQPVTATITNGSPIFGDTDKGGMLRTGRMKMRVIAVSDRTTVTVRPWRWWDYLVPKALYCRLGGKT